MPSDQPEGNNLDNEKLKLLQQENQMLNKKLNDDESDEEVESRVTNRQRDILVCD